MSRHKGRICTNPHKAQRISQNELNEWKSREGYGTLTSAHDLTFVLLFGRFILFLIMCIWVYGCEYVHVNAGSYKGQKSALNTVELELQVDVT